MLSSLFAISDSLSTWPIERWLIWIVLIAGGIAIACVVLKTLGYQFPAWFIHIIAIIALVVVAVIALKVIFSL